LIQEFYENTVMFTNKEHLCLYFFKDIVIPISKGFDGITLYRKSCS